MSIKESIKASSSFRHIEKLVKNQLNTDEKTVYINDLLNNDLKRITAHLKKDGHPTIWRRKHHDWFEEVWTKAIDQSLNSKTNTIFLDSEFPLLNSGNLDLIIRKPNCIEIIEVKVGNETKALRESVFYALALRKVLSKRNIHTPIFCFFI